ncbi:uncharacterized protein LOC110888013 [Helianthus annuus]|uniref:uncharacterized protein LOC110888013 n=1 Tax=Helianthus annuus TaxID=4232 RepID=UPI000B8FAAF3|nr:uncharacterized protein LOC110888013 [Helianthus annuus]
MEALSCMLSCAREAGIIRGIPAPNNGPVITHLLYADDAIMVGDWSKEEVENTLRILRCFYLSSGLNINFEKSNLFGIGVGAEEIGGLAIEVGCKPDALPFKYLGLKVGANMNWIANWQPVIETFQNRLLKWKSHLLSIGVELSSLNRCWKACQHTTFCYTKPPKRLLRIWSH